MSVFEMPPAGLDGLDPDNLNVPQNPSHQEAVELVLAAARARLGADVVCYSDVNWYPRDGGPAVAPDVMVLPAGIIPARANSYRQRATGEPDPSVVVEVPSETDSFSAFRDKLHRYQDLGVVSYVVEIGRGIRRFGLDDAELLDWTGTPMPELGGLVFEPAGDKLVTEAADGSLVATSFEFYRAASQQATAYAHRADAYAARVAALEAQLRALGQEPAG